MSGDNITKIKKISITKFRALENIDIEFADRITVICGKNGMAKSSILGIAAQCFSFSKDYTQNPPASLRFILFLEIFLNLKYQSTLDYLNMTYMINKK